jgi:hypothetical protein
MSDAFFTMSQKIIGTNWDERLEVFGIQSVGSEQCFRNLTGELKVKQKVHDIFQRGIQDAET